MDKKLEDQRIKNRIMNLKLFLANETPKVFGQKCVPSKRSVRYSKNSISM